MNWNSYIQLYIYVYDIGSGSMLQHTFSYILLVKRYITCCLWIYKFLYVTKFSIYELSFYREIDTVRIIVEHREINSTLLFGICLELLHYYIQDIILTCTNSRKLLSLNTQYAIASTYCILLCYTFVPKLSTSTFCF